MIYEKQIQLVSESWVGQRLLALVEQLVGRIEVVDHHTLVLADAIELEATPNLFTPCLQNVDNLSHVASSTAFKKP